MAWSEMSQFFASARDRAREEEENNVARSEAGCRRTGERRTPMLKAPPKSESATHGQGSREWSIVDV